MTTKRKFSFPKDFITQTSEIQKSYFNEDFQIGGSNANFSKHFGLKKIAAHYFKIPPGYRTSEPHAESLEEEFVFVISGQIDLWLNGFIKTMKAGDCIGFASGTGVAHSFINNSATDCELFVSGERTKPENQYHFPHNKKLNEENGAKWWAQAPEQKMGTHLGRAGLVEPNQYSDQIDILSSYDNIPNESYSYPGDTETFSYGVCLSRPFQMKSVAIWLEKLPSGKRSSWPHAHSVEEEFVFILQGEPHILLGEKEHQVLAFTGVDFKAGSGIAHTLINKTQEDIYYLCVGECEPKGDKIYYPNHPERNEQMRKEGGLWEEMIKTRG